jgi:hypothetical protein
MLTSSVAWHVRNDNSKKISYLILTKKSALTSPLNPLQRGTCTAPRIPVDLTEDIKICKTHKNNLPQINADQRRNNLRNPATSAGNKNHPFTDASSPFFRLGWCGNDKPSHRRTFHSIRPSGDCYSIVI